MKKGQEKLKIQIKKLSIRGDEIAILFFSVVFLAFLVISLFRLFAIGKLFDDFIFTFLFGWSKYLVYLFLFVLILPIYFNHYFKIKFSFIISAFFTFFAISWLVGNINLIIYDFNAIWLKSNVYNFDSLSSYFNKWWCSTIINNYQGFFAQPISIANWNDLSSYFVSFASSGIVGYSLMAVCNYGLFVTNWVLNLVVLFVVASWFLFSKPWVLFVVIFIFFWPVISYFKKKNFKNSKVEIKQKSLVQEDKQQLVNLNPKVEKEIVGSSFESSFSEFEKPIVKKNKSMDIQDVVQESGTLTPFGQISDLDDNSKTKISD